MTSEPCDGCGEDIHIAGGIGDLWTFRQESTGGVTLEFEDGTDHFLCYDCIEKLPDYPDADDVAALRTTE